MKSYFSSKEQMMSHGGINVSSSHQGLFLGNTMGAISPTGPPMLGSSKHTTGIKMIQEHHQSVRKAGTDQAPTFTSSPKNIIVKTNKFLFKNVAGEPQRAPKGDLGNSGN
jgi:hypothetical protein